MIKSGIITDSGTPSASDMRGFVTLYLTSTYDGTTTITTGKLIESRTRILGTSVWLEVDYSYNAQGWLTRINQPSLGGATAAFPICSSGGGGGEEPPPGGGGGPGGGLFRSPDGKPAVAARNVSNPDSYDLFYLELRYDNPLSGFGSDAPARQDGNISQAIWRVRGHERMTYGYTYDYLSRLTSANTGTIDENDVLSTENWFNSSYEYDARGNLTDLGRAGLVQNGSCWEIEGIDNLLYNYYTGTNRVRRIDDFGGTARGFDENGATLSDIYRYDANGNLIEDPYKGIDIDYNHLNLPTLITKGSETLEILYSADGTKLQQVKKTGSTVDRTRDYLGGIEYLDTDLDAIYHSEGRLFYGGASTPEYEYHLRDHLGNTRITFADLDDDGVIEETAGEVLQENHYYPFGMRIDGPWAMPAAGAEERYRYNGKELVGELGLNWYAYGARYYDAAIGRFTGVDPIADEFPHVSTYNYAENEPIAHIDLWGLQKVLAIMYHGGPSGKGRETTAAAAGHTGEFFKAAQRTASENGRKFSGTIIAPGLTSASGVKTGKNFISENYESGDQVILYGYSYGVDVAMDLATELAGDKISVDLLITVDGSDGPMQNVTVNKDVPENVVENINIYQTDDSGDSSSSRSTGATTSNSSSQSSSSDSSTSNSPGSNGSRNRGTGKTEVHNVNATESGTTHGNIQQRQDGWIRMYIRHAILNYQKSN